MAEPVIRVAGLGKSYVTAAGPFQALKEVSLEVRPGEYIAIMGPSGSGKSTFMNLLGCLDTPTAGDYWLAGENVAHLGNDALARLRNRTLGFVFQGFNLLPRMSLQDNVALPLVYAGVDKENRRARARTLLDKVGLGRYAESLPSRISGGQQQRVAIARAIVNRPQVLLLDEPLGALDLKLRKEMQIELKSIQQQVGITFVYVTHDQEEALTMSDTVVVMNHGNIQQIGTPVDIYNEPINSFVADFIGESNIIPGVMHSDFDVTFAGIRWRCVDKGFSKDEPVDVVIRPEDLVVGLPTEDGLNATVTSTTFKGVHYEMMLEGAECSWMVHSTVASAPGTTVGLGVLPYDIHIMKRSERPKPAGDFEDDTPEDEL